MQTIWLAQGPVRAAQWGLVAAAPDVVWIEQWRTWLPEFAARGSASQLLSAAQHRALWQSVVDQSESRSRLLDSVAVANWAAEAWSLLRQYEITDPVADGDTDTVATLLSWGRSYEAQLSRNNWRTRDDSLLMLEQMRAAGLLQRAPKKLILLDISDMTPLEERCVELLSNAGWQIEQRTAGGGGSRPVVYSAASQRDELKGALAWLLERLNADPRCRVALVAPSSYASESAIRRCAGPTIDVSFSRAQSPLDCAPVAHALNALEMLGPAGDAESLSAWLRSPFLQGDLPAEIGNAARFEIAERESVLAQLPLQRQQTALLRRLSEHAPAAANRLGQAFTKGEDIRSVATITNWVGLWQAQLSLLGWMVGWPADEQERVAGILDQGFDTLASLGSMLGAVDIRRALRELRAVLSEPLLGSRLPVAGLHVLQSADELGPGYAAAWVLGVNNAAWPEQTRPNPMLPLRLQIEAGMPWAAAVYRSERAQQTVERALAAVPELTLSWSRTLNGEEAGPAAVLSPWLDEARDASPNDASAREAEDASFAELETAEDDITSLRDTRRLRGGASLLNFQATCPLRAFIDFRLHARELPRRARGISRALRGQLVHDAAARLLCSGTASDDLHNDEWSERIAAAVESSLQIGLGHASSWFTDLVRFEAQRTTQTLMRLTEAELEREQFSVVAVEQDVSFSVSGVKLRARIDRIDRLASGASAIIDYKTGASGTRPYWFDEDHADYQMPLYAVASGLELGALVLCSLLPERAEYRGFWLDEASFPRRTVAKLTPQQWQHQTMQWKHEIAGLIDAFVAGDNTVFAENAEMLHGMYAPLSRLYELQP